jgi:hypothetical protein
MALWCDIIWEKRETGGEQGPEARRQGCIRDEAVTNYCVQTRDSNTRCKTIQKS